MSLMDQQLKYFADYIESELGIIYQKANYYQLEKRLTEICQNLEIPSNEALYQRAHDTGIRGHFKQLLLDLATNNETSFFRDPKIFRAIEKHILPKMLEDRAMTKPLRIWSAASSFGQEPYTLSMLFAQIEDKGKILPKIEIFASDISDRALDRAKQGRFSQLEVQRGLPAPLIIKYFKKKSDDHWHLDSQIRDRVSFRKINLLDLIGVSGKFDLILCRNVLIYQNEEKKKKILENLCRFIEDDGFLVLGGAESLLGLSDMFKQHIEDGAVFYQKK